MKRFLVVVSVCVWSLALFAGGAQNPAARTLEGKWEGVLVAGPTQLRAVINITKAQDGLYLGTLTSVDQGNIPIPIDKIQLENDSVRLEVKVVNGVFEGTLSADNTRIKGAWSQGGPSLPLELTRTSVAADSPKPPSVSTEAALAAAANFGLPIEMMVPMPPTPFQANGKTHLAYELHITNFGGIDFVMSKLEVLQGASTLASFEGADLNSIVCSAPERRVFRITGLWARDFARSRFYG